MTPPPNARKITERSIENAALFYLQRFASSAENLKRVLMRKVRRAAGGPGADPDPGLIEDGAVIVDGVVNRFVQSGLLDDRAYAAQRAVSLHRRGLSTARIRHQLALKGVGPDAADHALAALAAETAGEAGSLDLAAAVNLARRRRLGPFRQPLDRSRLRGKDLAALARAGFGYHLAVQVIDAPSADALEDVLGDQA